MSLWNKLHVFLGHDGSHPTEVGVDFSLHGRGAQGATDPALASVGAGVLWSMPESPLTAENKIIRHDRARRTARKEKAATLRCSKRSIVHLDAHGWVVARRGHLYGKHTGTVDPSRQLILARRDHGKASSARSYSLGPPVYTRWAGPS